MLRGIFRGVVLKWFYGPPLHRRVVFTMGSFTEAVSRRNTFVGGTCAPPSALQVFATLLTFYHILPRARDIDIAMVRPSEALCRNGSTYHHTLFSVWQPNHVTFRLLSSEIPTGSPPTRALNTNGVYYFAIFCLLCRVAAATKGVADASLPVIYASKRSDRVAAAATGVPCVPPREKLPPVKTSLYELHG